MNWDSVARHHWKVPNMSNNKGVSTDDLTSPGLVGVGCGISCYE